MSNNHGQKLAEKLRLSQAEAAGLAWPPPSVSLKKARTS
jgi:hypothetical protein